MPEKTSKENARAKFLEALEKKKQRSIGRTGGGPASGSKVGGASGGDAPKRFQRKSGSA